MSKLKKILVVDDDESILDTLELILETENYIVYTAKDGEIGLEKAKRYHPDVIILDIKMPKISGHLFASLVTQDKILKDIPIILLTGMALIAGPVTLDVPGVKYKLNKPFDHMELLKILKRLEKNMVTKKA